MFGTFFENDFMKNSLQRKWKVQEHLKNKKRLYFYKFQR